MTTFDVPKFICSKICTLIKAIFFGVLAVIEWLAGTSNQSKSLRNHDFMAGGIIVTITHLVFSYIRIKQPLDVSTSTNSYYNSVPHNQLPRNHSTKQIYDASHFSADFLPTDTQQTKHLSGKRYERKIHHDHKQHCKSIVKVIIVKLLKLVFYLATHKKCNNPSCKKLRWQDSYGYCSTTCLKRHRESSHQGEMHYRNCVHTSLICTTVLQIMTVTG